MTVDGGRYVSGISFGNNSTGDGDERICFGRFRILTAGIPQPNYPRFDPHRTRWHEQLPCKTNHAGALVALQAKQDFSPGQL